MAQKILLVEDDPCFGSVLKSYLELSDYEVTLCVNGNDGLEAFRKDKFDICLLDVMMPEMDGFTFCLLYTSPSPRDRSVSRMPSSA